MSGPHEDIGQIVVGLRRLSQVVGGRTSSTAVALGLSKLQSEILMFLEGRDSGLPIVLFARRFMISPATVSDSIRVLASKGLVAKNRQKGDARSVLVTITESGRMVAVSCIEGTEKLQRIVAGWDEGRRAQALSLMLELIAELQENEIEFSDRMCTSCRHFAINCDLEGGSAPYYCRSIGIPLKSIDLRVDCPVFEPRAD